MTTVQNSVFLKTNDDIISAIENFNHAEKQAAWSAISTDSNLHINIEYSSVIKNKPIKRNFVSYGKLTDAQN